MIDVYILVFGILVISGVPRAFRCITTKGLVINRTSVDNGAIHKTAEDIVISIAIGSLTILWAISINFLVTNPVTTVCAAISIFLTIYSFLRVLFNKILSDVFERFMMFLTMISQLTLMASYIYWLVCKALN